MWRNAPLWRDGRTELAQQMHTKDMISVETLLEGANGQPMATPESEEFGFSGARKIEQIGQNACEKLLQGMLKDLTLTGRSAIFIVDLNVSVGDMFQAFCALKSTWNYPTFYLGCTDDAETAEWFDIHKQESCPIVFALHGRNKSHIVADAKIIILSLTPTGQLCWI